jgi:hypothetical protein
MDRSFEAGIDVAWDRMYYIFLFEISLGSQFRKPATDDQKSILDFDSIAPFFLILAFGFFAAVLEFPLEIFHHDFVSELSREG